MKILATTAKNSGCGYHRIVNPLHYLPGTRYVTDIPSTELLADRWDIYLYNRISPVDVDMARVRQLTGAKIVLDLDDYWVLPPDHNLHQEYIYLRPRIERNIREADAVTVTHERLADKVYPLNKNVHIIPNALPFGDGQFMDEKIPAEKVRLFWAGGSSHLRDVEILKFPMQRVRGLDVHTVVGGYSRNNPREQEVWDRIVSAFTCGLQIPGCVLPSLPPTLYMNHYAHADICLVPLESREWNGYKSNLKLLEAACKKVPVVVSKTHPYLDAPVFYVETKKDWFSHINRLVKDETLRRESGLQLYEWAQQFELRKVNERRKELFASLCGQPEYLEAISENGGVGELSPTHSE